MKPACRQFLIVALGVLLVATPGWSQLPSSSGSQGLRPATGGLPSTSGSASSAGSVMVPLNPTRSIGFDPYASTSNVGGYGSLAGAIFSQPATPGSTSVLPPTTAYQPPSMPYAGSSVPFGSSTYNPALTAPGAFGSGYSAPITGPYQAYPSAAPSTPLGGLGMGSYPSYNGPGPIVPGAGQSAIVQTNPSILSNNYNAPGVFPSNTPSALFPGTYNNGGGGGLFGGLFGGSGYNGGFSNQPYNNGYNNGWGGGGYNWNQQGSLFNNPYGQQPGFIRLFQGPRFRHAYLHGNKAHNDVSINDTDLAIAMLWPNFGFSNQPIYILPSFSLHQWAGPRPDLNPANNADLPSKAYSAFIDAGWQSDPNLILGAELGVRVGMFSSFESLSIKGLRIQGRGIGRIRLTPQSTLKLGVMYLDRNRVKILPAGGILWQPNPATRLDLFFPEPKLSSFLTTLGTMDTWWYVAGYYGGGNWRIKRTDGSKDNVDINDIRIVLGIEWGRNDMMRDGRRIGFLEGGYVFDRELYYKARPADNLRLQDTFVIRAGFGY